MMKIDTVYAFTREKKGGNPAGVCLYEGALSKAQMQEKAFEMGLSETVFLKRRAEDAFDVGFFTPNKEIELCGHATLGGFGYLFQKGMIPKGTYTQHTKAGALPVFIGDGGKVWMKQNPFRQEALRDVAPLVASLGLENGDLDFQVVPIIGDTGVRDILIGLRHRAVLERLKPDFEKITKISEKQRVTGYHVFVRAQEGVIYCRNFAPLYGILEESATGTSNGALGAYLVSLGFGEKEEEMCMHQGMWMDAPSQIFVRISKIHEVWVGGHVTLRENME